jgi:hypothetical protein
MWKLSERFRSGPMVHKQALGREEPCDAPKAPIAGEGTPRQAANLHLICVGAFGGVPPAISQQVFIGEHVTPAVAIINAFKPG